MQCEAVEKARVESAKTAEVKKHKKLETVTSVCTQRYWKKSGSTNMVPVYLNKII